MRKWNRSELRTEKENHENNKIYGYWSIALSTCA